jgi:hypothetical protein
MCLDLAVLRLHGVGGAFVYSVSDPLNADAVLDLALLDGLTGLCEGLAAGSDGTRRVKEIVDGMSRVAWEVVKKAARRRERGSGKQEEGEGTEGLEGLRSKRQRSGGGEVAGESEQAGAEDIGRPEEGAEEEATGGFEALNLETAPQNFQWDQWDQWLEDAPFGSE